MNTIELILAAVLCVLALIQCRTIRRMRGKIRGVWAAGITYGGCPPEEANQCFMFDGKPDCDKCWKRWRDS